MDISRIPGNSTHMMLSSDNTFGYVPRTQAAHYVVYVDSSGKLSESNGRRSQNAYTTGYAIYGFSDDRETAPVENCIGAGGLGRWSNKEEYSQEFEERGLQHVAEMLIPKLPGVAEGESSVVIKCDNAKAIDDVRAQFFAGLILPSSVFKNARIYFTWERGHNGVAGNNIADLVASFIRRAIVRYGILEPVHVRDIIHSALMCTDGGVAMEKVLKSVKLGSIHTSAGKNKKTVFVTLPRRKKWQWNSSAGGSGVVLRDEHSETDMLERISYVAREAHPDADRIYIVASRWQHLHDEEPIFSWLYRDQGVVLLSHLKFGEHKARNARANNILAPQKVLAAA